MQLKTTKLFVEYEYNFDLLAIISPIKEYKLAWSINKSLEIELTKKEDILLDNGKGARMYISNFDYETEYSCVRMLKNKPYEFSNIAKPYLLSELKDYDYFIQLEGEADEFDAESFREALSKLKDVQYVTSVDVENLKSKENLLF